MRGRITELAATRWRAAANAFGLSPLSALRLALLAAVDFAALAFAIGAVVGSAETAVEPKSQWRPPQLLAPPEERAGLSGDERATMSRPIFWRSRRAPPPRNARKGDAAAQAATSVSGVTLGGVVKVGERSRAFLIGPGGSDGRWLEQGESIEGWTIEEIDRFEVTITDGAQSSRLRLYSRATQRAPENGSEKPAVAAEPLEPPEQEPPPDPTSPEKQPPALHGPLKGPPVNETGE
ncbi:MULTISPECIES: hypothetical protein [Methylosinus]|uniref:Type II secretion system protein GspC N-terminal domain-containing protein n=1 Tax=Methylosinus trichosporium (strain ATCC 35070 / NCIMB 11131 / UNIQEM 75 / OB3b) TaxID=595536 RepID=A0A2D2CV51_METT3|nr:MULTISPECIES: hypothetical protein [Methylosinus]ATQ66526.1 hypothetical protein CQW49_00410 [Methylosinus trichosporium OB3b]OBS52635.1 hypothetical protein A8B73_10040 [Methylosinus sp. 3S-1]